jgi:hypothetical protein
MSVPLKGPFRYPLFPLARVGIQFVASSLGSWCVCICFATPSSVDWVGKFVFLVLVPYGEFRLSSDDFYLDSSLVQGLIYVEFLIF